MTKAIIFDLGGILVPEKGDIIRDKITKMIGISSITSQIPSSDLKGRATRGEISLYEYYKAFLTRMSKKIDPHKVLQEHLRLYESLSQEDSQILLLIKKLKENYLVACLTNTEIEITTFNKKRGLFDHFDRAYISTEMRLVKPQREIYQRVLEDLAINSDDAFFIDDQEEYVRAAEMVGTPSVIYKDYPKLIKSLQRAKIIQTPQN